MALTPAEFSGNRFYANHTNEKDENLAFAFELEEHHNVIVLTIEELEDIWAVANQRGYHIGQYGNSGIHPQDLHSYLESKGVTL